MKTGKPEPKPRISYYYGSKNEAHVANGTGTWVEAEEMCYPSGGLLRRARVICPDGEKRIVMCGIADTAFSLPAVARIKGKYLIGCVTREDEGYKFTPYAHQRGDTDLEVEAK